MRKPCGVLCRAVLPVVVRTLAWDRGDETTRDALFLEEPPVLEVCELFIEQIMLAAERNVHEVELAAGGRE